MKRFVINALKYNALMALIPSVALFFYSGLSIKNGILAYLFIYFVLFLISIVIQGFFTIIGKMQKRNEN